MAAENKDKKRAGDACDCGAGRLRTRTSRPVGEEYRIRYLECVKCGGRCRCVIREADARHR
jgi:hypothetical protein